MDDKNPAGANDIFRVFIMRPDRQKALILEVSHIDEQGGIIFSDQYNDEAKTRRQSLVERVKKSLHDSTVSKDNLLRSLPQNPETFFKVLALTNALHKQGITDGRRQERCLQDLL